MYVERRFTEFTQTGLIPEQNAVEMNKVWKKYATRTQIGATRSFSYCGIPLSGTDTVEKLQDIKLAKIGEDARSDSGQDVFLMHAIPDDYTSMWKTSVSAGVKREASHDTVPMKRVKPF